MSSRQLRKLQQQRELEQARLQAEAEEVEESDDEPVVSTKSKASLFANLAALTDEDSEKSDEQSDEVEETAHPEPAPVVAQKKARKSKKKKKAKSKAKDVDEIPAEAKNDADDIDRALRELNLKTPSIGDHSTIISVNPGYERVCALLGINAQHLKVANEMRSLFGRAAIEVHDEPGGHARGQRNRQRGQNQQVDLETALKGRHAPGKGLPELTLRRNSLIQGKDDWPKAPTGGLTMVMVDDQQAKDGTVEFRFDHNKEYQALQQAFYGFVEMGDPQNLIGLLVRNPYHISLLIQVSKVAKDQTDHALSSDLLERALFTFGRAATTLFNNKLSMGKARLDFARPENREIWLAGYQYIKSLVMKGTYRTALEWAKVLLSFDPEADPYCMRFMIHHLALRASEFNWLLDLFESDLIKEWEDADDKGGAQILSHFRPSLAIAAMSLKEGNQSRKFLTESMQTVPWLFCRLFKELNLDAPPSIWGIEARSDSETLFTEIYVRQAKDLWNTPEATALLMEIAHTIPKVDIASVPVLDNSTMTLDVVRFVYLDNTPTLMALAPSKLLHRSNNSDADPLPPDVNTFSYETQKRALRGGDGEDDLGGDFFNPLAALARLLPSLRQPGGEEVDIDDEEIRRELERAVANDESQGPPDGNGGAAPVSLVRWLGSMLWGSQDNDDEDEWTEDEGTDTDGATDEEMPDLVEQNPEDYDDMPELIDE